MTDNNKVPDRSDSYSFSGLVFFLDRFTKIYCFQKVSFVNSGVIINVAIQSKLWNKYTKQINPRLYKICATVFFFLFVCLNAICWTRLKLDTAKPKLKTEQVAELTELETELMTEVEDVVMADNKVSDPILLSFLNTRKKAGRAH